uniref:Ig-like domain-containing protein n=1 Tax=Salmo trutta TaxID=8032 RepID=A0A674F3J1_SALTR
RCQWSLIVYCRGEEVVDQPSGQVTAIEGELVTLININNLYLFWYKHEVNGFPKFMLGRFSFGSTNATGYEERFDAHLDKNSKSVPLMIQRLQLSDSAVYYCALKPTVTTGYTQTPPSCLSVDGDIQAEMDMEERVRISTSYCNSQSLSVCSV